MFYRAVIKEFGSNDVVKTYKWTKNQREAEKIEGGVEINLNHEKFYTIIERSSEQPEEVR